MHCEPQENIIKVCDMVVKEIVMLAKRSSASQSPQNYPRALVFQIVCIELLHIHSRTRYHS